MTGVGWRGGGNRYRKDLLKVFQCLSFLLVLVILCQPGAGYSRSADDILEEFLNDEYTFKRSGGSKLSEDVKEIEHLLLDDLLDEDQDEFGEDSFFNQRESLYSDSYLRDVLRDLYEERLKDEEEDDVFQDNQSRMEGESEKEEESKSDDDARTKLMENDLDFNALDDIMMYIKIDEHELEDRANMQPNFIKVAKFLKKYQLNLSKWRRNSSLGVWTKETNLTKYNINEYSKLSLAFSNWDDGQRKIAEKFGRGGLTYVQKRMLKDITRSSSLKEQALKKLSEKLSNKIGGIYSKAKVCRNSTGKCYHFEPGLIKIMRDSRDYDELLWAWKGWRDAIGPKIREDWITVTKLSNLGAREHGYNDEGEYLRERYEDPNFVEEIDGLWKEIDPIYKQLHAYVRYKLNQLYGDKVPLDKPIPAHLLGNMWAMKWDGLLKLVEPYPDVGGFDVTKGMKEKNMTTHQMFTLADSFYQSIGLPPMPPLFWEKSMFTRPKDNRSVVCYASAHNMEKKDVRVKMCAAVTADYLYVVHHEMGHCQYYLAYNMHQPELFQSGANNGFHEAIGDTAALSVISPKHLLSLGILKPGDPSVKHKKDLNFLMQKALGKLAFYPFALTMDKYMWDVYNGKITWSNLNAEWWQYRKRYQGVAPPIERSEHDFDPGSKYHITYFVPYIRYFVSHVLQFQFYESLCRLANHEGNLHDCDFAGSKTAGASFEHMLQMGSSRPWPDALEVLTGTRKMSVAPIIRYFEPLLIWLKAENKRLGNKIGWD